MGDNDRSRGLKVRRAAGGVVYHDGPEGRAYLLIRDPYGRWSLPKGHLEGRETEEQAAVREVLEETGVRATVGPLVARITYAFPSGRRVVEKHVTFFLMRAESDHVSPQIDEGITAVGWFSAAEAQSLIGYEQVRQALAKALALLDGARPSPDGA
jgi:8-oxo-dGTP pyrophosphatase MutT (NUDIX family)